MSGELEIALEVRSGGFLLALELSTRASALGLFGPSGAGKTTALEALCGWRSARGRIALEGRTWLDSARGIDLAPAERGVAYVPQDLLLFPHWDVRRNLLAGARQGGREALAAVAEVLEIAPLLERSVGSLSGGERQRVALGRALCARPALLLLDEPLSSLDHALRRRILAYLLRVRARLDVRLVFVSHHATEVAALCDEVAVLRAGRLVARGAPAEVFAAEVDRLAEGEELDNVLRGRVEAVSESTARVALGGAAALEVPRGELALGNEAVIALRADDVLIAVERPRAISARNVLAARVRALVTRAEEVLVRAELGQGGPLVTAQLTPAAARELELAPGREAFLVVKTRACRVLASLEPGGGAS